MTPPEAQRKDALRPFPIRIRQEVQWGEMDYFRHVNNTVFFRYFESARIAYLERIGFADEVRSGPVGPILHSTQCRFRRPLVYPDTIEIGARSIELGDDRFTMEYLIWSESQGLVAADGGGIVVSFDYEQAARVPIPETVRRAIEEVEGWGSG